VTVHQFSLYSYQAQYEMLKEQGIFLMTRHIQDSWLVLFAFQNFYVEVIQVQPSGQLRLMRCFEDIEQLAPYLSEIDINPVLNN
jgi:hypothetical protein